MKQLEKNAEFFKALGDETRLKVISFLMDKKEICICDIAKQVGKNQSTVYRHILILKNAGIVNTRKEDKFLMCQITKKNKLQCFIESINKCRENC